MQNRDIFFFPPSPLCSAREENRNSMRGYTILFLSSPLPSPLGIARGGKLNNISSNIYAGPACFNFTWSNRSLRNLPRIYRIGRFRNNSMLGTLGGRAQVEEEEEVHGVKQLNACKLFTGI